MVFSQTGYKTSLDMRINTCWHWITPLACMSGMIIFLMIHSNSTYYVELTAPKGSRSTPEILKKEVSTPEGSVNCREMVDNISLAPPHSMPLFALASFPRSGNTWTRYLLQIATQIYTTSVYWKAERSLKSSIALKGSSIDFRTGRGIVVKSHLFNVSHVRVFEGAILLIRNPYESSISEFFRLQTYVQAHSSETARNLIENKSIQWLNSVKASFAKWRDLNIAWINNSKKLLIVFYEDLARNPEKELIRMLTFLDQPIRVDMIRCAIQTYPLRKRTYLNTVPFYPPIVKGYVTAVNKTLIQRHAISLPNYEYL